MTLSPEIIVLCGGLSSEREVSLRSGQAVASVLPGSRLIALETDALPEWLDGAKHVVLPVLHGGWGEDGRAQAEMEARGIAFGGCSSAANRLCMDKVATKHAMRAAGVPAIPEVAFAGAAKPTAAALVAAGLASAALPNVQVREGGKVGDRGRRKVANGGATDAHPPSCL